MQFKQRNIATMLVAKGTVAGAEGVAGATTISAGTNINIEKAGMFNGEPAVVNMAGVVLNAGTASTLVPNFRIAVKLADGDLKFSDTINAKMVKKVTVQKYVAGTNQVDYIGYNGTTGSIDVLDNNVYKVNITYLGTDSFDASRRTIKHGVYKSDAAATQSEIAAGLTNSLITNFSREGVKLRFNTDLIKFERVNSATGTDTSAGTATVIKGSKYVTIAESTGSNAGKYNSNGSTIAVGDLIRFTAATEALTDPCYLVTAVSGAGTASCVLTLDIPYQGATNTAYAANAMDIVAAASIGNWGIKMTGAELPYEAFRFNYTRSTWTFGLDGFGSTIKTNTTAMTLGSGAGKAVNELESKISTNRGNAYLNAVAVKYPTLESSTSGYYAIIHIQYTDEYVTELGISADAHKELYIACEKADATCYKSDTVGLGDTIDAYASKYSWDIVYNGSTTTAGTINA